MNIKKELPTILGACLALIGTATAATITWTGSGDGVSLFQEANWDAAGNTLTGDYIPKGPGTTPHDLVINIAGSVGGTNGWGGTLDLGNDGSLTVDGAANYFRMSTTSVLKNGTAYFSAGNANFDFRGTWDNMNVEIGNGIDVPTGTLALINGTTLDTQWLAYNNVTLNDASSVGIRGNGNVFQNGTIDFLDLDSTLVFTGGKNVADVTSEHLSNFTVNGEAAVLGTNINIFTDGGFTTVQAVPEPQTAALISGLLALTAIMIRRRKG